MKKTARGLLSCLLAAVVFVSGITVLRVPAGAETWGGILTYGPTDDGTGIVIMQCSFTASGTVTVPEQIGGVNVVEIAGGAFLYHQNVTGIVIPDTVSKIGVNAFLGTGWYDSLSDGPVYAGKVLYAYKGTMPEDTVITVANGTLSIVDSCFSSCANLAGIVLDGALLSIGTGAFYNCTSLTEIELPVSLKIIGGQAFQGCTSLESVTVNSDVEFVGADAFSDTPWFNSRQTGPLYIGKAFYKYCGTMPDDTDYIIADGTVSVTESAFSECTGLSSITIPASVTDIGSYAFIGCVGLESITVNADNEYYTSVSNVLFNKDMSTLILYPTASSASSYNIPDGVVTVEAAAFYQAQSLAEITVSDSVEVISSGSFAGCTSLTSITFPKSIKLIDEMAFMECAFLADVTVYGNETVIQQTAFYNCSASLVIHGYTGSTSEALVNAAEGTATFDAFGTLTCQTLDASGAYIRGLTPLSTVGEFAALLAVGEGNTAEYIVGGVSVTDTGVPAGTGTEVIVKDAQGNLLDCRAVVIAGDVSGDSVADALDLITIDLARSGNVTLTGAYRAAALENYSFADDISESDYLYVQSLALS